EIIHGLTDSKTKEQFISEESEKLSMHENIRVEAFISELGHYRSHFLITSPSTMEEVKTIVQAITKEKEWNKSYSYNDSDSDFKSSTLNESDEESDNEDTSKPFIKKKSHEISKPAHFKAKEIKNE